MKNFNPAILDASIINSLQINSAWQEFTLSATATRWNDSSSADASCPHCIEMTAMKLCRLSTVTAWKMPSRQKSWT